MNKGQISIEYLIILLVAVIILLTTVFVVFNDASESSTIAGTRGYDIKFATGPIGIEDYRINPAGLHLDLINNLDQTVNITAIHANGTWLTSSQFPIVLAPKQRTTFTSTDLSELPQISYEYDLLINYTTKHRKQQREELTLSSTSQNTHYQLRAQENIASGLVGLWQFEAGSYTGDANEVRDSSSLGGHGNSTGNVNSTSGVFSSGVQIGGTSHYINTTMSYFDMSVHSATLALWVKTSETSGDLIVGKCFTTQCDLGNASSILFALTGGNPRFYILENGYTAVSAINDANWHHIAGVYNYTDRTVWIYVDGNLITNNTVTDPVPDTTNNQTFVIGGLPGWGGIEAELDEIALWNRTLSTSEIHSLYLRGYQAMNQ